MRIYFITESTNCQNGDVRLVGGKFVTEGRVEVCTNGIWGTVCGTGFNAIDAYVVCKELGLGLSGNSNTMTLFYLRMHQSFQSLFSILIHFLVMETHPFLSLKSIVEDLNPVL